MYTSKAIQKQRTRTARTQAALKQLRTVLQAIYGPNAPMLVLYGSEARGEATETSDVDILLVFRHSVNRGEEIRRLGPTLSELNLNHDLLVSVLPVAEAEYRTATGPFWSNVRREGVLLERS